MIGVAGASVEVPVEFVSEQTGLHEKTIRRSFKRLHQRNIINRSRSELNRPYTIKLIDE